MTTPIVRLPYLEGTTDIRTIRERRCSHQECDDPAVRGPDGDGGFDHDFVAERAAGGQPGYREARTIEGARREECSEFGEAETGQWLAGEDLCRPVRFQDPGVGGVKKGRLPDTCDGMWKTGVHGEVPVGFGNPPLSWWVRWKFFSTFHIPSWYL